MRTVQLVIILSCAIVAYATNITAAGQQILYSAPSNFYRPDPAFFFDSVRRTLFEINGNDIFAFDIATGIKRIGNPGPLWSLYNGAFSHAGIVYIWASDSTKSSLYLLKYNVDSLNSKILSQDKVPGIDVSQGPASTVCTAFDPTNNIAYVGAQQGSAIFAVNVNNGKVISSFDLRTVDAALEVPLSAPCGIDLNDKTIYFSGTHYNGVLGNKYRVLALDISDPNIMTKKILIDVPGPSFQVDTTTHTISGTDKNGVLYQVDPKASNGSKFTLQNYETSGQGFVVVDPRDSSTFLFDAKSVTGPLTLQANSSIDSYRVQTLPRNVVSPGILDAEGCRIYVRSSTSPPQTFAIPINSPNGGACATVVNSATTMSVSAITFLIIFITLALFV